MSRITKQKQICKKSSTIGISTICLYNFEPNLIKILESITNLVINLVLACKLIKRYKKLIKHYKNVGYNITILPLNETFELYP